MLKICSSILLISQDESLVKIYTELANSCEVELRVESKWNVNYRVNADKIVTTSDYLGDINVSYFPIVTLILKPREDFIDYKNKIDFYIFDVEDSRQLLFTFLKQVKEFAPYTPQSVKEILKSKSVTTFCKGEYDFNFAKGIFIYKGKALYITKGQQRYLAEWLINGHKDNAKRMNLQNMRAHFGKEFLADIDRYGNMMEE